MSGNPGFAIYDAYITMLRAGELPLFDETTVFDRDSSMTPATPPDELRRGGIQPCIECTKSAQTAAMMSGRPWQKQENDHMFIAKAER